MGVSLQGSDHAVALTAHGRVFTWGQPLSRICSAHQTTFKPPKACHILDQRLEACTSLGLISGPLHGHFSFEVILHVLFVCLYVYCYVFVPCCANLPTLKAGTERFQRRNIAQPLCVEGPLRGLKISKVLTQPLVIRHIGFCLASAGGGWSHL